MSKPILSGYATFVSDLVTSFHKLLMNASGRIRAFSSPGKVSVPPLYTTSKHLL